MKKVFTTKDIAYSVKDMDMKQGIVQLYASTFDKLDDDGDIMRRGAFTKTIQENGVEGKNRIKQLYQHDVTNIIGKPLKMYEDEKGLYVESYITEKQNNDYRKMYEEGLITEHSIGFMTMNDNKMESGENEITEVKLFEYSAVTYGANSDTPVVGMKSSKSMLDRLNTISNVLKKGTLTDDGFKQLQVEYEQLKAYILKSLETESQPTEPVTTEEVEPIDLVKLFKTL